jgi:hypothetical protein
VAPVREELEKVAGMAAAVEMAMVALRMCSPPSSGTGNQ